MVPFSERLFMNRKIKAYQAIIYIVLFYLAAVLFLLGPGKLLEKDRLLAGAENPVGTVEVREDQHTEIPVVACVKPNETELSVSAESLLHLCNDIS